MMHDGRLDVNENIGLETMACSVSLRSIVLPRILRPSIISPRRHLSALTPFS